MEGWTKLDNVELHTSYHSPDSIRVIRKRKNKQAEHVAHMGRWQICIDVVGGRKGRSPLVKPRCRREVILKWILGKLGLECGFYSLRCSRDGLWALVNIVMILRVHNMRIILVQLSVLFSSEEGHVSFQIVTDVAQLQTR